MFKKHFQAYRNIHWNSDVSNKVSEKHRLWKSGNSGLTSKENYLQSSTKYIWQSKEINKIGQENFDTCFCVTLDCWCEIFIFGWEVGH